MTEKIKYSVTQNGKPLDPSKYTWDEKTRTFSSLENNLVLDFRDMTDCTFKTGFYCSFKTGPDCTFKTGWDCTFNTGSDCTFNTGSDCTFNTGWDCTFNTGSDCTFKTSSGCTFNTGPSCTFNSGSSCTFNTGWVCTFNTGSVCTFNTGSDCTFNTGSDCTFKTGFYCSFKTGPSCTFNSGSDCTFNTGWDCTFKTGSDCTFKTGSDCTFKTSSGCTFNSSGGCTFNTGSDCVVVRRDIFEIIKLPEEQTLTLAPFKITGYVLNGYYYFEGEKQYEAIIADGILSKIFNKRVVNGLTVYKVINHGEDKESYLVFDGENYSHGETLEEAKDDLVYKIKHRDTSMYKDYTLETVVTKEEAITMYRTIAGACAKGTKLFVKSLNDVKDEYTVKEIIELTTGRWNNDIFRRFFEKGE